MILANPNLQNTINPMNTNQLLPSCSVTGRGVVYPPRRITTVAGELAARGAYTTVQSICATSFTPAVDEIAHQIALALGGAR